MVHEYTILRMADNAGARKAKCIRVLGGSKRRYAGVGDLIVVAVHDVLPNGPLKEGEVARAALEAIPGVTVPGGQGAFYLFPDFSAYLGATLGDKTITDSLALSEMLLEQALVAAVPGQAFGMDGHLRLSYSLGEEAIEAVAGFADRVPWDGWYNLLPCSPFKTSTRATV